MEITIKIENEEEIIKLKELFENSNIKVAGIDNIATHDKKKDLIDFFKKYQITLPKNFKFDREEANER